MDIIQEPCLKILLYFRLFGQGKPFKLEYANYRISTVIMTWTVCWIFFQIHDLLMRFLGKTQHSYIQ